MVDLRVQRDRASASSAWSSHRRHVTLLRVPAAAIFGLAISVVAAAGQERAAGLGEALMQDAPVRSALDTVRRGESRVIEEQIELCEIAAPPFKEQRRAQALKQKFEALGLKKVRLDSSGNVMGDRPGLAERPRLVFSAHLDTVFPDGTAVKTSRAGPIIKGPGIGDDCRGLAVVLGVIRALNEAKVQTPGTVTFVGTVGEEGLGDLRGVKHLFAESLKGQIDRFVSVDGIGFSITNVGVGSHRYRVTFKGPGGHSYGAFGLANPIHALGRAIGKIADLQVPTNPRTTFSVGRTGGGTAVNAIASEAWMEVDLRSVDPVTLQSLDASFMQAVDAALAEENQRWGNRGRLTVTKDRVGERPAGRTPEDAQIVQAAVSVSKALGLPVFLQEGSTDANLPMSRGIPAIAIDGGGRSAGGGAHALSEAFDSTDSSKGTERALLLAVALAQK